MNDNKNVENDRVINKTSPKPNSLPENKSNEFYHSTNYKRNVENPIKNVDNPQSNFSANEETLPKENLQRMTNPQKPKPFTPAGASNSNLNSLSNNPRKNSFLGMSHGISQQSDEQDAPSSNPENSKGDNSKSNNSTSENKNGNNRSQDTTPKEDNSPAEKSESKLNKINNALNKVKKSKNPAKNSAKSNIKGELVKKLMKNPYVLLILLGGLLFLLLLIIIIGFFAGESAYGNVNACDGGYWWPIGSVETTTENGVLMATGTPEATTTTSLYGYRDCPFHGHEFHSAPDIASNSGVSGANIIASMSGEVTMANDNCTEGDTNCGGSYGNYVEIKHSDGKYTFYAHLQKGSVKVKVGDVVFQGQVIGNMGSTGSSTGPHLHFEMRLKQGYSGQTNTVDPFKFVSEAEPRYESNCTYEGEGGEFNSLKTSLTKAEFVSLMNKYGQGYGGNFVKYFQNNAELIYDVSVKNNINPELVVVTAETEMGYSLCGGYYNFWGIGIPNGTSCENGPHYSSMEEGITGYAKYINEYASKDSQYYNMIMNRYKERVAANCAKGGYGTPDTLEGMQSIWSGIGEYWINPGSSSVGGCYYMKAYLNQGFMKDKYTQAYYNKKCGTSTYNCQSNTKNCFKTTTCEKSDYTKWQVEGKVATRKKIFGI